MTANHIVKWYDHRAATVVLGILMLGLAYLLGSRAFDTGSWWEYLGTLVLIISGFNRLISTLRFR